MRSMLRFTILIWRVFMKKRKSLIVFLASITCALFLSACEVDVPVKEMAAARDGIAEAKKYDAEKYAADDIKRAEALLVQSHKNLVIDENEDDARKSANDALLAANNARNKSLPSYSADQIKKSEELYKSAEKAYAEKYSPNNFAQGKNSYSDAKAQYDQRDYVQSIVSSEKASEFFTAAINDSLRSSSSINSEITSLERRLSEIKKDKNSSAAASNLSRAENSTKNAKRFYGDKDFKSSWKEIDAAKKELDYAVQTINKQGVSSSIAALRSEIKDLSTGDLSQDAVNDLNSATTELNGAELSVGQNNIRDAESRVKRAEGLVNNAKAKIKKNDAAVSLNNAESLLAQARKKDSAKKYEDDLDKAENLIKEGKSLAASGKYAEAKNKADEAERLISAVFDSMESDARYVAAGSKDDDDRYTDDDSFADEPKGKGQTYIVQWRKNNPDCLWKISQKFYKDASFWPAIYIANKNQIKDPDIIFPGHRLVIPPKPKKRPVYKK